MANVIVTEAYQVPTSSTTDCVWTTAYMSQRVGERTFYALVSSRAASLTSGPTVLSLFRMNATTPLSAFVLLLDVFEKLDNASDQGDVAYFFDLFREGLVGLYFLDESSALHLWDINEILWHPKTVQIGGGQAFNVSVGLHGILICIV